MVAIFVPSYGTTFERVRLNDDEEILFIVRDEVMSFLDGVGSAGDCAAKIQSRASLWLSEHGGG